MYENRLTGLDFFYHIECK